MLQDRLTRRRRRIPNDAHRRSGSIMPMFRIIAAFALLGLQTMTTARAQSAVSTESFQGKTVIILVGSQPGGGYDLYARFLAQYLGRHIPGQPAVVVQNMPGAGGLRAARHLASVASRDGTALGILAQTLPFDTLLGYTPDIDASAFNWLGRIASNPMAGVTFAQSRIISIETARNREISVGGSGGTSISTVAPFLLNKLAGTRFKLIAGYQSANEVMLAMERGEVEMVGATGIPIIMAKYAARLRDGTIRLLYQTGQTRHPGVPDVPTIGELGTGSEEKQILDLFAAGSAIGYTLMAPPGVPAERIAVLRRSMAATLADPEMLAYATTRSLALDGGSGDEIDGIVRKMLATPRPLAVRARQILESMKR
jgi:tripartite-type tricarboxylate transporter receptor subunit TctC